MPKRLMIIILTIICIQESCSTDTKNKVQSLISKALKFEKRNKYVEAIEQLNEAIRIDSTNSLIYVYRGRMKSLLDQEDSAIQDFSIAIKLMPQNTAAYFHKGISFSSINNMDSAIANFNSAILTKKKGDFYFDNNYNEFDNSIEQIDIGMPVIRYFRGVCLYEEEQDSAALADFYYSLANNYNKPECQFNIGVVLLRQGRKSSGCDYLNQARLNGHKDANDFFLQYCK